MNPAPNITQTNFTNANGMNHNAIAIHTDKHVTQSNGFNLLPGSKLKPRFIAFGIPAIFTK
jgi:hypothetical protein